MLKQRRTFEREFKLQVLNQIDAGSTIVQAAREHGIHPETVRLWRKQIGKYGDRAFAGRGNAYSEEAKIAQLERTCGQLAAEHALLKKAIKTLQELDRGESVARRSRR
jgi:transposase